MNNNDITVVCPWCNTLNTIPEQLIVEAKTFIVRKVDERTRHVRNLRGLTENIREKVISLFKSREDSNEWLDVRCINTCDKNLGVHSFQVNIRTKEARK